MTRLRQTIVLTQEYELDPSHYPPGASDQECAAIDAANVDVHYVVDECQTNGTVDVAVEVIEA